MQTLTCYFLKEEMPDIKEVIPTLDEVEILSEKEVPQSDLVYVVMMVSDASMLYTIGLIVANKKAQRSIDYILKNLKPNV